MPLLKKSCSFMCLTVVEFRYQTCSSSAHDVVCYVTCFTIVLMFTDLLGTFDLFLHLQFKNLLSFTS